MSLSMSHSLDPIARPVRLGLAVFIALVFSAGAAWSLDGIDLSIEAAPVAAGECPPLTKIKYPFLTCTSGAIDLVPGNDNWANSRRMPQQSEFIEGDGVWGKVIHSK